MLLSFPRVDHLTDKDESDYDSKVGLHYGTVLSACQIILGNDKSANLSYDQAGEMLVELSYDGFLTCLEYYLQTPGGELLPSLPCEAQQLIRDHSGHG